jgi:FkbM family methyltransferase
MKHIQARIKAFGSFTKGLITFSDLLKCLFLPSSLRPELSGQFYEILIANQYHIELITGGTVVDAGANAGIFSIVVARKHPECEIYAFEPAPSQFKILVENTKDYKNIHCLNTALGDMNGTVGFSDTEDTSAHIGGNMEVEIRTLDSFNLSPSFIKMDCEGYEGKILEGAAQTIKQHKPVIAMSAYHKPEDKEELPRILKSITPYSVKLHHDCEEDFICRPIL